MYKYIGVILKSKLLSYGLTRSGISGVYEEFLASLGINHNLIADSCCSLSISGNTILINRETIGTTQR